MVKLCVESTPGQRNGVRMNALGASTVMNAPPQKHGQVQPGYHQNTSTTAAPRNRPLCMRPFMDNDEHDTSHLGRDAICFAQVDGERSEQRKPKTGVRHPKGWWWKGGSAGGQAGPTLPKKKTPFLLCYLSSDSPTDRKAHYTRLALPLGELLKHGRRSPSFSIVLLMARNRK
jgi:hypothetical protein